MATSTGKNSVSTQDVAALNGPTPDATNQDATGRVPGVPAPDADPSAPIAVKVVDVPTGDVPEDQRPYSTREGRLSDAEQVSRYGHVLTPADVFVSEGMRHDIVTHGFAIDPMSGKRVERA